MNYLEAKGWLTEKERQFLLESARMIPTDGTILNIGVEFGASVWCLHEGAPTSMIHICDVDLSKAQLPLGRIMQYQMDSSKLLLNWKAALDFILVDGDHTFFGVVSDAQFSDFLKPSGIIAFHDCYAWEGGEHKTCPEVNKAVEFWRESHGNLIELPTVDSIRSFQWPASQS